MKKNKKPLVSVIVPAYNTEKFVGFCMSSLVTQTYDNVEVIVIDDGSSDGTRAIIEKYVEQDKRVKLIGGEHQGANRARGLGVENASGDYYMFVDSDDWLARGAVEALVDAMANNDCDIVRFNAFIEPGKKLKNPYIGRSARDKLVVGDEAKRLLTMTPVLNNLCFQFYRADLLNGIKAFEHRLSNCEDHCVNLEVYEKVDRVLFISDVLYYYRNNFDSTTKNSDYGRILNNVSDLIFAYSMVLEKAERWRFSENECSEVAMVALDKVRSSIYALNKVKDMSKQKFIDSMKNVFEDQHFREIKKSVGSREKVNESLRCRPALYKIKYGKGLLYVYDEKPDAIWRAATLFRTIVRVRVMMRKLGKEKVCGGGYDGVAKYMRGRLGNQLFQYAAMRQIQEINGDEGEMYLNFSKYIYNLGFKNDLKDFRVRPYVEVDKIKMSVGQKMAIFVDRVIKRVYRLFRLGDYRRFRYDFENKKARKLQRRGIYWKEDGKLNMQKTDVKNKIAIGHFESAKNFDKIRLQLIEEIQPIESPLVKNKKLYEIIEKEDSVCISIRRGDFVENPVFAKKFNVCGKEYFEAAVKEIKKRVEKPVFVLFSDDIEWCKRNIELPGERVYYEDGTDPVWEKLRLMYSCKHFIISNSTFSWWAQYLSRNEKKVVIAPKIWSNSGYNKDIYDESWVIVDNEESVR